MKKIKNPNLEFRRNRESKSQKYRKRRGAVLIFALGTLTLMMLLTATVIGIANAQYFTARILVRRTAALNLAEAGVEKAIRSLNLDPSYAGETGTVLGEGEFSVEVSGTGNSRTVTSKGFIPNSTNPLAKRTVKVVLDLSTSDISFLYGVQVGDGGLFMNNNARVNGNVYSNGNIWGGNGATITGTAIVAGGTQATADQEWTTQNADFAFGQSSPNIDPAQSFIPSQNQVLNKISLYLKKVGDPADKTLRIVSDNGGVPSKTTIATGTLRSSQVTASYGWIDISLSTPPNLSAGTSYWILIDSSTDANNYFIWGLDTSDGYPQGTGKVSANWNSGNPTWSSAGGDFNFKVWMGGVATYIDNVDVLEDAYANTSRNNTIGRDAFGRTLEDCSVGRNASADNISGCSIGGTTSPGVDDPPHMDLPISEANIAQWKADAEAGGTQAGPYELANGATGSLGPKKVTGNLKLDNNAVLTVTGTLWFTDSAQLSNNCIIRLDPSYGTNSGIIIIDGDIQISNNCQFQGAGEGSYVLLLTTLNTTSVGINVDNNSVGVIYYANNTKIKFSNVSEAKEATAWGIEMDNNAVITYESGLANARFTSGPGGGWKIRAGSWQEIR